jgi:diguanylate cyclase (GGDEF)-like protein
VLVSVAPEYFTENYDVATLGQHGLIAVVNKAGDVLAARIGKNASGINKPLLDAKFVTKAEGRVSTVEGARFFDGRDRYVASQLIGDFNVIVIGGLDKHEVFESYQKNREIGYKYARWNTVVLIAVTLFAMYMTLQLQRRKQQIEEVRTTYRLATERGSEGFYILRAHRDATGKLVDLVFVDCNNAGANLYKLRPEQLIGMSLSSLLPNPAFKEELEKMRTVMAKGYLEEEVNVPDQVPMNCEWIHRRIVQAGNSFAVTVSDITERKAHLTELKRKGYEDALTGLHNRHWLSDNLESMLHYAERETARLALMFVDLDHFKHVNDSMGHSVGDELLKHCAQRLLLAVRPGDEVIRLGGDEFLIILAHLDNNEDARNVAERVLTMLTEKFRLLNCQVSLNASIGISFFPDNGKDAPTLLRTADIAMYAAKITGRGHYSFYDENFDDRLRMRRQSELDLQHALDDDEFIIMYQPRLDIRTGEVCSMEALVRWQHPQKGIVSPNEFIPLAEETGLIVGLGELVMSKVFLQVAEWMHDGRELLPVSINVSARQFNETNVYAILENAFKKYKVNPDLIEVELTEASMTGDIDEVSRTVAAIQKMGVKVLVDDFGTGYSSLAQLQKLDMDVLKVDRAFTLEIARRKEGKIFFSAIITMAHALGMRVVAEGVEDAEQVDILKSLDCDEIQGFLVSRPLAASALQDFLRHKKELHPAVRPVS